MFIEKMQGRINPSKYPAEERRDFFLIAAPYNINSNVYACHQHTFPGRKSEKTAPFSIWLSSAWWPSNLQSTRNKAKQKAHVDYTFHNGADTARLPVPRWHEDDASATRKTHTPDLKVTDGQST